MIKLLTFALLICSLNNCMRQNKVNEVKLEYDPYELKKMGEMVLYEDEEVINYLLNLRGVITSDGFELLFDWSTCNKHTPFGNYGGGHMQFKKNGDGYLMRSVWQDSGFWEIDETGMLHNGHGDYDRAEWSEWSRNDEACLRIWNYYLENKENIDDLSK